MNQSEVGPFDEERCYDIRLWIAVEKSLDEFEASFAKVIAPIQIAEHRFSLGDIECEISQVAPGTCPKFAGVATAPYRFCVTVPTVDYLIWGCFDKLFTLSLSIGVRTRFSCEYLVTADDNFFIAQSGTNRPLYINTLYPPWLSGELTLFKRGQEKTIELQVPRTTLSNVV